MTPRKKEPLESTITARILKRLNSWEHSYFRKIPGGRFAAGFPDIIGTVNGRLVMLEVKRPSGQPTELQKRELARWGEAGAIAGVVRSVEEAEALVLGELRAAGQHPV